MERMQLQFKTQVAAASKLTRDRLDEIQKAGADPDWESVFVDDAEAVVDKLGDELYSVINYVIGLRGNADDCDGCATWRWV